MSALPPSTRKEYRDPGSKSNGQLNTQHPKINHNLSTFRIPGITFETPHSRPAILRRAPHLGPPEGLPSSPLLLCLIQIVGAAAALLCPRQPLSGARRGAACEAWHRGPADCYT